MRNVSKKRIILVVEDSETSYCLINEILADSDVNLKRVMNGEDAVRQCAQNQDIDLVIMDIVLPGIDGISATKEIKLKRKNLKIIAISALVTDNIKNECIEAGCDEFIPKPIDIDYFRTKVHDLLEGKVSVKD